MLTSPTWSPTFSINRLISGFESVLRRAGHSGIEFEFNLDPQAGSAVVAMPPLEVTSRATRSPVHWPVW